VNKGKIWLLIFAIFAGCTAAVWGVIAYRARYMSPAELIQRLPAQDALLLYIDFSALRRAGLLQLLDGSHFGQEPEYVHFVQDTDFNYVQDLDSTLAAFAPTGKYILAKGRFDWKALSAYALKQHGECYNAVCKMAGSTPDRNISFLPLQSGLMALAVSQDPTAATRMEASDAAAPIPGPDAPVWMSLPKSILKAPDNLPEGTQLFAKTVQDAKSVTLGFSPEGDRLAARLNVPGPARNDRARPTEAEARRPGFRAGIGQLREQGVARIRILADRTGVRRTGAIRPIGRGRQFIPHMPGFEQRPLGQTGISADLAPPACAANVECCCAKCCCPHDGHSG